MRLTEALYITDPNTKLDAEAKSRCTHLDVTSEAGLKKKLALRKKRRKNCLNERSLFDEVVHDQEKEEL